MKDLQYRRDKRQDEVYRNREKEADKAYKEEKRKDDEFRHSIG